MSVTFGFDEGSFSRLQDRIAECGSSAESVINNVLHEEGGEMLYERINPLIHPSGRTFKGHRASAASSDWKRIDSSKNLSVTITTKSRFNYLYFPNDGSNTVRHFGNQRFFERGGEDASDGIAARCLAALTKEMEG